MSQCLTSHTVFKCSKIKIALYSVKPELSKTKSLFPQWISIPFAWTHEAVADIQWSDWTTAWVTPIPYHKIPYYIVPYCSIPYHNKPYQTNSLLC